jgi:chemotaxis protein MotB
MARKKKHPEHVNHERWLVSYADFVTLLFAFFTALYAMSTLDAKKAGKMAASTRAAFNMDLFPNDRPVLGVGQPIETLEFANIKRPRDRASPSSPSKKPASYSPEGALKLKEFRALMGDLNKTIDSKKLKGMTVSTNKYGLVISLKDAIFFDPAKAELQRAALPALDAIAERVMANHLDMRIEGHTDGSMPHNKRYKSNWELSTARAASVVNYFIEQFAYPPEQLSIAGYASTKPVTLNISAEARAQNRRVDIVVLMPKHDWLPSPTEVNSPEPEPNGPLSAPANLGTPKP